MAAEKRSGAGAHPQLPSRPRGIGLEMGSIQVWVISVANEVGHGLTVMPRLANWRPVAA